ncbi:MAG: hypothetical protein AAF721_24110 [Myxococcota bacterium]
MSQDHDLCTNYCNKNSGGPFFQIRSCDAVGQRSNVGVGQQSAPVCVRAASRVHRQLQRERGLRPRLRLSRRRVRGRRLSVARPRGS